MVIFRVRAKRVSAGTTMWDRCVASPGGQGARADAWAPADPPAASMARKHNAAAAQSKPVLRPRRLTMATHPADCRKLASSLPPPNPTLDAHAEHDAHAERSPVLRHSRAEL